MNPASVVGKKLANVGVRRSRRAVTARAQPDSPAPTFEEDGAKLVAATDGARREKRLGLSAWWAGVCSCPKCAHDPRPEKCVERYGKVVVHHYLGRRVPAIFTLADAAGATIAYDCLLDGRDAVDPEIEELLPAAWARDGEAYLQPRNVPLERGIRPHEIRVLRGFCPGCGGLSDGNLCLACRGAKRTN